MSRHLASLTVCAASLVWLGAVGVASEQAAPTSRPNIVLMFPDNLGWGEVNVYGGVRGRGDQIETSRAEWNERTLIIVTTFDVADRAAGKPYTAEVTRKLRQESPTTLIVEAARGGVLGGPASTRRSIYKRVGARESDSAPRTMRTSAFLRYED